MAEGRESLGGCGMGSGVRVWPERSSKQKGLGPLWRLSESFCSLPRPIKGGAVVCYSVVS